MNTRDPNTFSKTNYQLRQKKAKQNSQRLFMMFSLMTCLTALCYAGMMYALVSAFGFGYPLLCGAMTAFICVFVIGDGYYIEQKRLFSKGAVGLATRMGGKEVGNATSFHDKQLVNIVEEMSIASGVPAPTVMIARNNSSINAFVTCDEDGENHAITVSQGAVRHLNREELQAVIAHEFGHIKNGDVLANVKLSAVLHGFFMLSDYVAPEFGDYDDDDYGTSTNTLFGRKRFFDDEHESGGTFGVVGVLIWLVTSVMIFFGRLLQAAFSRARERLADAHAVQYTRNGSALVSVFTKILALQHEGILTPKAKRDQAHFLFFDYQQSWATHSPITERIQTYGYMPSTVDLEAVLYRLHNPIKEQVAPKKEYDDETGLSLMPNPNQAVSTAEQAFEQFLPLMILHQYQQSLDANPEMKASVALNHVIAHFVHHGGVPLAKLSAKFQWDKKRREVILASMNELSERHESIHLQLYLQALNALNDVSKAHKQYLLKVVNTIVKADRAMTWHEMCMLLCFRATFGQKITGENSIMQHQDDIAFLVQVMANISSDNDSKKQANYALLVEKILPSITAPFELMAIDSTCVQTLYKTIIVLQRIKPVFLKDLLTKIEANIYLDNRASVQQVDVLETLKRVFR